MVRLKTLLLAGAATALIAVPAMADESRKPDSSVVKLAQAEGEAPAEASTKDPIELAEEAVEKARAALREAMATGGDIEGARKALRAAQKKLKDLRKAAGLEDEEEDAETARDEAPPVAGDAGETATLAETPPEGAEGETAGKEPKTAVVPRKKIGGKPILVEPKTPQTEETAEQAPPAPEEDAVAETPPDELQGEGAEDSRPKIAVIPRKKLGGKPILVKPEIPQTEDQSAEAPAGAAGEDAAETPSAEAGGVPETPPAETGDVPTAEVATAETEESEPKKPKIRRPKAPLDVVVGEPPGKEEAPVKEPEIAAVKSSDQLKEGQAIEGAEGRIIVKEGGQVIIQHDDDVRFRRQGGKIDVEEGSDGTTTTTVSRPNGIKIVTIRDPEGNILQRFRQHRDGQIEILIGSKADVTPPGKKGPTAGFKPGQFAARKPDFDFIRRLPPLQIQIPPQEYVVESEGASKQVIEKMLIAPPVEEVERPYTLEEIRRSGRIRAKLRRIDVDTVTFEFGKATVPDDQIPLLEDIGQALASIIDDDPSQVFLVEGHTDAVGSDLANLSLSDRRAETVAEILTYYFDIPPENLVTQGYGEQFLKIPTLAPERLNRRVSLRNITRLLHAEAQ